LASMPDEVGKLRDRVLETLGAEAE